MEEGRGGGAAGVAGGGGLLVGGCWGGGAVRNAYPSPLWSLCAVLVVNIILTPSEKLTPSR